MANAWGGQMAYGASMKKRANRATALLRKCQTDLAKAKKELTTLKNQLKKKNKK